MTNANLNILRDTLHPLNMQQTDSLSDGFLMSLKGRQHLYFSPARQAHCYDSALWQTSDSDLMTCLLSWISMLWIRTLSCGVVTLPSLIAIAKVTPPIETMLLKHIKHNSEWITKNGEQDWKRRGSRKTCYNPTKTKTWTVRLLNQYW